MQEIEYNENGIRRTSREFFEATTQQELFEKMKKRFAQLETEKEIVEMRRVPISARQARKLRKEQKRKERNENS